MKTKIKKVALPEVVIIAMVETSKKINSAGLSFIPFIENLGIVSYFIVLTIRNERTITSGIVKYETGSWKPIPIL